MTAPDPTILADAIKKAEADLQTFRGIDDPEIKKLVEFSEVILVAAKAYGPMREALKAAKREIWESARHQWAMADFKNWAVIQQIDAALKINGDL